MQADVKLSKLEARYQFQSLIGKGGAGEVYAAWDDHLKRTVAIKRINPKGIDDAALANPWSEAIRLAAVRHANIVTVYDMGNENDIPYIVMEHVQGETIDERVAANGVFSLEDFAEMTRQTLDGMLAAHHAGLIHRDLKPSNIMLSPLPSGSFHVKILDFGMAKFVTTPCAQTINIDGSITGSVCWISPEQLNRQAVDARSDLYSLGCVFYYALTGKMPFDGPTALDIVTAHLSHNVVPLEELRPDLPPLLVQWLMSLINLQPEHRYQTVLQALTAFSGIISYTQPILPAIRSTTGIITPAVTAPVIDARTGHILSNTGPSAAIPATENAALQQPDPHTQQEQPAPNAKTGGGLRVAAILLLLCLTGAAGYIFSDIRAALKGANSSLPVALTNTSTNKADTGKSSNASAKLAIPAAKPAALLATSSPIPAPAQTAPPPAAAPAITVAVPTATPIPTAVPAPLPAEMVFRVAGSNTIGAKLLPALMCEFLKAQGATRIERKPGKTADDLEIQAVMNGETTPKAILIEAHGSATAFEGLTADKCDLGMSSRPIKSEEATTAATGGLGDLHSAACEHVLGLDGIAILASRDNPVASLTKQQIAGIFSGQITDWKDAGGTPGHIHVLARDAKSGTFDTFKSLVLDKLALVNGATRFEDSRELSDAVAGDPAAIGFAGLPFIRNAKAIAVSEQGTSPFIPTRFTVATEDYLLSRRLFLYTSAKSQNPLTSKFLEFALSDEGQVVVNEMGFVRQTPELQRVTPPVDAPERYTQIAAEANRMSLNLRFRPSSKQLDNKAVRDIDRIVNLLNQTRFQGKSLILLGFADSSGSPRVNEKLSQERADIVAKEFSMRGVSAVNVMGFGSVLPVASNDTEAGREKNRRVEVWIK